MHGFWFLIAIPLAAVLAWRLFGSTLQRISIGTMLFSGIGLALWFGYLAIAGSEFTESIFDRVMHAIGVIISSVDVPVLQLLCGALVVVCWPPNWTHRAKPAISEDCGQTPEVIPESNPE